MEQRARIERDEHGVPHVEAGDEAGLYWGMGRCHAMDRGMQMLLMRIAGRGQICEYLNASDEMLAVDVFFRRMNWRVGVETALEELPAKARGLCIAYCEGVNSVFSKRTPWELRLMGYRAEPWTIGDSLLLSRMTGYVSLAQSQADMERLLVEMVQAGTPRGMLEELFPGILQGLDEELVRKAKLTQRVVPPGVQWNVALPRMMASNNWVVAGSRTASGKPILANDPHLETNRLPNIWYEIALRCVERYAMGATMPGLPAVIIGRTPEVAWGVTYAFMDAVDSWVEECREGKCRRGAGEWVGFKQRKEVIRRKGKTPVEVTFYENEHGVLDGDPFEAGYYLATRWSGDGSGVRSIAGFAGMWEARSVAEGMRCLGKVESAWNWVLADREGNIGYQMSGLLPRRREGVSGFVPLPGWEEENDWRGFVGSEQLPRCVNPASGYFITANHDLNGLGEVRPINVCMSPTRAERIEELLKGRSGLTAEEMFRLQYDVYSKQAEMIMHVLRPLLPETPQGRMLREWDCRYTKESQGAFLFERVYRALLHEVFGRYGFGRAVSEFLAGKTGLFAAFHGNFDRILLAEESAWFGGEDREELYRRVAAHALQVEPRAWGEAQQVVLAHILFQGKLPRVLGFDRGPITIQGGRATIHQGTILHSRGRLASFTPSFHLVTDMGEDVIHTNLCGGPSDRRLSKWYVSGVKGWVEGEYKGIRGCRGT